MRENDERDSFIGMRFKDENHQTHVIKKRLSAGGQGVVYCTQDPNVLIKLKITKDPDTDEDIVIEGEKEHKNYVKELMDARILEIPDGVKIARPVVFLSSPYCGYIMRMLDNMSPIQKLMYDAKLTNPFIHYLETGGLKRRIQILSNFAKTFALLHSKPLIYGDLSEGNLFVSNSTEANETWLIDADNLRHSINFSQCLGTKGYRAPEIFKETFPNTTCSDAYSFAIIAYKVLTYRSSPFIGELATNPSTAADDGWDDDTDPDTLAELGELPWVDDPKDDSNRAKGGFKLDVVASSKMIHLFDRTFGEEGRHNPPSRPTMEEWYDVLSHAANLLITCKDCSWDYFFTNGSCPICKKQREKHYLCKISDLFDVNQMLKDDEDFKELDYSDPRVQNIRKQIVKGKVFQVGMTNQGLTNDDLQGVFISQAVENWIEIELHTNVLLRNKSNNAFLVIVGSEQRLLHPHSILELFSLDDVKLVAYFSSHKSRVIEFEKRG